MNRRRDARMALMAVPDVEINMIFRDIGRGNADIHMQDLIWFLEANGFAPKTEDLEAILRRCDHDADRMISLEEFAEAIGKDYTGLLAERDAKLEAYKLEREMTLEQSRLEADARRKEWESKLELERLEREKRLDEIRIQEELSKKDREEQLERYRLEREQQILEWRSQQEAARKDYEAKLELEKIEREKRGEQIRLE
jgi:hypothetical protein